MELKFNEQELTVSIVGIPRKAYRKIKTMIFMFRLQIRKVKVKWLDRSQVNLVCPDYETYELVHADRAKIDNALSKIQ